MLSAHSNGCGLWYQRIVETAVDVPPPGKTAVSSELPCLKRQREADSEDDDDGPRQFRRVRIRCRQRARKARKSPTPKRLSRSSKLISKVEKRRPKTQASQGDAVLIGFMGGLNDPDLATKVGEVPLPQFDDSDVDDPIDADGRE